MVEGLNRADLDEGSAMDRIDPRVRATTTTRRGPSLAMPALSAGQRRSLRAALEEQRRFRVEQLRELARDPVDSGSALAEVSATLSRGARSALAEIETALELLRTGGYGRCTACGDPIPFERLEILPMTTRCIGCQRGRESDR
jgi:RNA polymerase-binding transcription factor DksA